ncbi:unnamed protein product, partial [Rangifer tarandus platyrhynchus]
IRSAFVFRIAVQSCPTLCDPMDCSTPGLPCPIASITRLLWEKKKPQTWGQFPV